MYLKLSKGIEFLKHKTAKKRFSTWISYTYMLDYEFDSFYPVYLPNNVDIRYLCSLDSIKIS
jgi:serine protease inhibitor ecotin